VRRYRVVTVAVLLLALGILSASAAEGTSPAPAVDLNICPPMKRGSTGDCVIALQRKLAERTVFLAVDGHFGPQTEGAVRALQESAGLTIDGIAGPQTVQALLAPPPPPPPPPPSPTGGINGPQPTGKIISGLGVLHCGFSTCSFYFSREATHLLASLHDSPAVDIAKQDLCGQLLREDRRAGAACEVLAQLNTHLVERVIDEADEGRGCLRVRFIVTSNHNFIPIRLYNDGGRNCIGTRS
jgi:hypothetical protein